MMWTISFYHTKVHKEIKEWPVGIYADFLRLVAMMEKYGTDLRMPHSRALGRGLFELRCKGKEGIGRAFYCTEINQHIVILHSIIKKTEQTPREDMALARKRLHEVRHG